MTIAIAVKPETAHDVSTEDDVIIGLWLDGAAASTQAAYGRDMMRFRALVNKPFSEVSVADIQRYQHTLKGAPSSRNRAMNALRSFFRFAHSVGHLQFNPMTVVRGNKLRPSLGRKYLNTAEIHSLIAEEPNERNRLLLQVLYFGALRVSELCRLTWRDIVERSELDTVQLSVFGKGGIPREVPLPPALSKALLAFRGKAEYDAPVFPSRNGRGHLDRSQVLRIVQAAAKRVGITQKVSPHWLRHAHATHAIAQGVPLHVVQSTLGHSSLSVTGLYLHSRPNESSGMYLK